ncbi:MAG: bifunctional 3,4-dihydroxy-2-butanone-4-phosphate synthase/GTP cyclohydrolase II [Chloroflexota bacterium]|jgi:3,4-dihydroxy 2-butanone 4-phosphate synthase/GTP cyclohydrolase II|nr:bifunctional 3,4-dihydroxy-2-butanone-4-phosphate synthase/GTP cyclohydrolase II [Chloroflexota bacterium]MED6295882.1 bifunctional 3,4-dihydroxy-2-butanone-4-phosphate synthase/GTP cyclohydrolase II [Chloroflexota bacterium]
MPLSKIEEAIDDIKNGKMVIVIDDEDRENEGDLTMAAEMVTPEAINFMATYGRGLICVPMLGDQLDRLNLPLMVSNNTASLSTAFTVSVDSLIGTTTGISASDRSDTIKALINEDTKPEDLGRPGHIFPLRYVDGGVLKRTGQTEASIDLCRLAGLEEAAVICEIMADDGNMARMPQLEDFAKQHDVKIVSVEDLIAYRRMHERLIERVAEARVPTEYGEFRAVSYSSVVDVQEHVAFVKGDIKDNEPALVRVHSECLTGDVFGSKRCDCGYQVQLALEAIEKYGSGVLLYMRQEGRGIGIHNKLKAYALQDEGYDTVEANVMLGFAPDPRQYGIGAQILADLGVQKMKLLTNNPTKRVGLEGFGLEVVERVPIIAPHTEENTKYMETKRERMGHILDPIEDVAGDGSGD